MSSNSLRLNFKAGSFVRFSLILCINFLLLLQKIITNLVTLNNTGLFSYNSGSQKSKIAGLKSRGWQSCFPFGGLLNGTLFLPFPASSGCLLSLAYSSLLSSKPLSLSYNVTSLFLTLTLPFPPFKHLCTFVIPLGPPGKSGIISLF